jgi:hypothetical protein
MFEIEQGGRSSFDRVGIARGGKSLAIGLEADSLNTRTLSSPGFKIVAIPRSLSSRGASSSCIVCTCRDCSVRSTPK